MMPPRTEGMMLPNHHSDPPVPPPVTITSNSYGAVMASDEAHQSPAWLQERCAFWQRQLRLEDWDVEVKYAVVVECPGSIANTRHNVSAKEALIRVLHPNEWHPPSERFGAYDVEQFLVHELLHLVLVRWKGEAETQDSDEWNAKELAIDQTAAALVRLERGERR